MALIQKWSEAGTGTLTSTAATRRTYLIDNGGGSYERYSERSYSATRKWVGLAETAVAEAISANEQPLFGGTYSYSAALDNAIIGCYSIERLFTLTESTLVENGNVVSPSFSHASGAVLFPQSVTVSSSVEGGNIVYRVSQWEGGEDGSFVPGTWQTAIGSSVDVSVNSTNLIAQIYRKVRLEAYVKKTVDATEVVSGTTLAEYTDGYDYSVVINVLSSPVDYNTDTKSYIYSGHCDFKCVAPAGASYYYVCRKVSRETIQSGTSNTATINYTGDSNDWLEIGWTATMVVNGFSYSKSVNVYFFIRQ